jgi:hypothetical protein
MAAPFLWQYADRLKVVNVLKYYAPNITGLDFQGWFTPDSGYLPGQPDGNLPVVYGIVDIIPNVTWSVASDSFEPPPRDADIWITVISSVLAEYVFHDVFEASVTALATAYADERIDLECVPSWFEPPTSADAEGNIPKGWFARVGVQPYSNCNVNTTALDSENDPILDELEDPITDGLGA